MPLHLMRVDDISFTADLRDELVMSYVDGKYADNPASWRRDMKDIYMSTTIVAEDARLDRINLNLSDINTPSKGDMTLVAWAIWAVPGPRTITGTVNPPYLGPVSPRIAHTGAQLRELRARVIRDRKHFLLESLGVQRGNELRGAAKMLISYVFESADAAGVICYVDTASNSTNVVVYEKLGFVAVDRVVVNLEPLTGVGIGGIYEHVAMVREPKRAVIGS